MHAPRNISPRGVGIACAGLLVAGLAAVAGPSLASASEGGSMHMSGGTTTAGQSQGVSPDRVGNTRGWFNGRTVDFRYTKNFFCAEPPTSAAFSHCEVGANYNTIPATEFDPLYVIVPIGFTPKNPYTVQCPVAGSCVDHPHSIDLSRVFGSGTEKSLLPPHSHIITTLAGGQPEWWNVDVIGVKSQGAWHRIVKSKHYSFIANMRKNGNPNVTENIPTNLFLYFSAS